MLTRDFLKLHIGDPQMRCHIDAVHAKNPSADVGTGDIVERVVAVTNVSGIVATISREEMDLNRPRTVKNSAAIDAFRAAIFEILLSKHIVSANQRKLSNWYLHLAIHGMRDERPTDFEIGTRNGESCDDSVLSWFLKHLTRKFPESRIGVNQIFPGDQSKSFHRMGDKSTDYCGYGDKFNTIQIEISRSYRDERRDEIVETLAEMAREFGDHFNDEAVGK